MLLGALTRGGFFTIILIAALFGWVQVCLLVRAQVKAFKEKEFVRAAQALGASPWYIIRRHLIPNSISPIIVGFVLAIPLAMMLEASLSFLGIGVPPPTPSWGQMINIGIEFHVLLLAHGGVSRRPRWPSPCSRRRSSATACAMPSIPP